MYWVAPEVFDEKCNEKADIFSLVGVSFYAILTRNFLTYRESLQTRLLRAMTS